MKQLMYKGNQQQQQQQNQWLHKTTDPEDRYQNIQDSENGLRRVRSRDGNALFQSQYNIQSSADRNNLDLKASQRRGLAKRRDQEQPSEQSHLRSVAQQYSQKTVESGRPQQRTESDWNNLESLDSRNGRNIGEIQSQRQPNGNVPSDQGWQPERQQSQNFDQKSNSKSLNRRGNGNDQFNPQANNAPEKMRSNQAIDGRLISEEEFLAHNENKKDNKARHPRRSKLTLGKQTSNKTQQMNHQKQQSRGGHSAENQRSDIVSQYLNVPINPDEPSKEDTKYPKATVRKYKNHKDSQSNMANIKHSNVPLMKDPSDNTYVVSHKTSSTIGKSSVQNNKLSENYDAVIQNYQYQADVNKEVEGILLSANTVISARTRSQSKQLVGNSLSKTQQDQKQNLFKTASNTQKIEGVVSAVQQRDFPEHKSLKLNNMKSADQMREIWNQEHFSEQMQKFEQDGIADGKAADTQSNSKAASGLFGFFENIKKNYFNNKDDEKLKTEDEATRQTDPRSGSHHTNESPNAGQEISAQPNINGAKHYQLKLKRAGVGMSPSRDANANFRGAPYIQNNGRAQKNYGDLHILTMSQPTLENKDSQVSALNSGMPFNPRFEQLEQFESDHLRMQGKTDNEQDLDNSLVTDPKSEIRRIQRKSQQETNGLNVLQTSKQVRSQHNYLGSRGNQQQAMTTKNQNQGQKNMFTVKSQSNKKDKKESNLRKMSYVVSTHTNQEFDKNKFTEYADDLENEQNQGVQQDDDAKWKKEIDYRKVRDTADLQMLKNQKRRSDLNLRLSKQIMQNGSEYSSPYKGDKNGDRQISNYSNQGSGKKARNGKTKTGSAARQVNLFGKIKDQDRGRSEERLATTPERSQRIGTSKSPPMNQEDFDQLYNLQDAESSDTNLQHNQNHKILHHDGLPLKKTVDQVSLNQNPNSKNNNFNDTKTPVQNSRISNYVPPGSSQNSYVNQQSSSVDQQLVLKHRGEMDRGQNQHHADSGMKSSQNYVRSGQQQKQISAGGFGNRIDQAFQSDLTQKYEENLSHFMQYQSKDHLDQQWHQVLQNQPASVSGQENGEGPPVMRKTANFDGAETEQDVSDRQQYNSAKPSDDKIVMKNRGHAKAGQQEGSFLELYGKNHIKSEQMQDRSVRANDLARDQQEPRERSPMGTDDNRWLFEGLQHSLNRPHRDHQAMAMNDGSVNQNNAQSYQATHRDQDFSALAGNQNNAQSYRQDLGEDQSKNLVKSAKYTMKSKSPRNNKVNNLHLLLRGKSQNRVDSRSKDKNAQGQNQDRNDQAFFPQSKVRDKSNPPSSRHRQNVNGLRGQKGEGLGDGLEIQDTLYNPAVSGQRIRGQHYQQRRGLATSDNNLHQNQGNKPGDQMVHTMYTFFKNIFHQDNRNSSIPRHNRQSAETKASSGQSAMLLQRKDKTFNGWSPQEALEIFGNELTEFEKIEVGNYSRVYTIGNVRRENQYSIADKDGFYNTRVGEHLGYRYLIRKIIDKGSFGQVVCCTDCADPNERIVAAKIGKNKKFDVDNANIEVKFLTQLNNLDKNECADNEGHDRIVQFKDSFNFRQHVIIIFEHLHMNLYKYISINKKKKPIFDKALLKRISYQIIQGLKYMKNKQVIHCDMKPENIIFTDQKCQNIKIIDFGASCKDWNSGFFYVQSRYYRAPEIVLGLPYDHAVDMWSLGCIVYELITGRPIFPAKDENELLEYFTITVGNLPEEMITQGKNTKKFFKKNTSIFGSVSFELIRSKKTIIGSKLKERSEPIRQLLQNFDVEEDIVDFIEKCLVYDVECRITPHDALFHQWFYVQNQQVAPSASQPRQELPADQQQQLQQQQPMAQASQQQS